MGGCGLNEEEKIVKRRQFIIRVKEKYAVPSGWNVLRVLATEDVPVGTGTNWERVYVCLAEEVSEG